MVATYLTGVSVLKKMTVSLMPAVIIDDISCQKLPHALGERLVSCSEQQTDVIVHKSPRVDAQGICSTKIAQTFKKIFPIFAVAQYLYSINAPAYNMM